MFFLTCFIVSLLSSPHPKRKLKMLWIAPPLTHLDSLLGFTSVEVVMWSKGLLSCNLCASSVCIRLMPFCLCVLKISSKTVCLSEYHLIK